VVNHLRVAPAVASRVCLAACLGLAALASCGRDAAPRSSSSVAVHVWLTTPDLTSRLSRQTDVAPAGGGPADVTFDDTVALQTIDGFGAAFTDSSASLI
jgi:glucosylceramidase